MRTKGINYFPNKRNFFPREDFIGLFLQTGREENIYKGDLLGGPGLTTPFTLSADGENLIVSSYYGAVVQVWNPQANQVVQTYPMGIPIDAI